MQRSWAKVIFSQASVCPQGGGVSASVHAGIPPAGSRHPPGPDTPPRPAIPLRPHPPQEQTVPPRTRHPHPQPQGQTPPQSRHPPGNRLQHMVYEQPVCILLECILVCFVFWSFAEKTFVKQSMMLCAFEILLKIGQFEEG